MLNFLSILGQDWYGGGGGGGVQGVRIPHPFLEKVMGGKLKLVTGKKGKSKKKIKEKKTEIHQQPMSKMDLLLIKGIEGKYVVCELPILKTINLLGGFIIF